MYKNTVTVGDYKINNHRIFRPIEILSIEQIEVMPGESRLCLPIGATIESMHKSGGFQKGNRQFQKDYDYTSCFALNYMFMYRPYVLH